jgi:uncharacterized protein YndB with AHSA1/START domain
VSDPGPVPAPGVLECSIFIAAPRTQVFAYFTEPSLYVEWMGERARLEPTPGGVYEVRMGNGVVAAGSFEEVDPPYRVVFTWGWEGHPDVPPGSTRVVVTLDEEAGGTLVVLRHHGLPSDAQRTHHGEGWTTYLERLQRSAVGADPGPDPNA